jgi:signal transduction histidine kinase
LVVVGPGGRFILVAKVLIPYRGLAIGALETTALGWLIPALCGALLCLFLARHIASPIRNLQSVASKIADGDLSVRASPAISSRKDELADLARDFDRMADRVQSLLRKQQELLGDISHELRSPLTRLSVLFEPFYRVSEPRDHQTGGTGLGLSIAQRIATIHGGGIRARNRDAGGLEIEIWLAVENPVEE